MSQNLATVQYGKIFLKPFRREIESMRDEALGESARVLRREEEASIRKRWYRTGGTLESLEEDYVTEGNRKIYRLIPSAFYAIFGEYGTGQRGSRTGRPQPRGYRYGKKPGMEARRFSRIAVAVARPQVNDIWKVQVREFAANLTR